MDSEKIFPPNRKSGISNVFMPEYIDFKRHIPERTIISSRKIKSNCSSHHPSSTSNTLSTASASDGTAERIYHYETMIKLTQNCKTELKWWVTNLQFQKGKPLALAPPDLVIQSDAAKTGGWGAATHNESTGGYGKRKK